MAASYLQFLQSPSTGVLASDASMHYITTTTTISEPTAILKHLAAQSKQVYKKEEKVLHVIEDDNACCVETLTTLQFRMGGGAYLPSMDSNMLDERVVTFPMQHVVTYRDEKIHQIRLYWDQGTLLKQVEAIGKTGRNWPIREGKAQGEAVVSSVKAGSGNANGSAKVPSGERNTSEVVVKGHQKRDSVSVTRDPHASLALFAERDPNEQGSTYSGPKYMSAKSAKPRERDMGELFTNEDILADPSRSQSPHKKDGTILKSGAGKNYHDNRLFEHEGENEPPKSPERKKVYPEKYGHFAFGDGEDAPKNSRPISKGNSNKDKSQATFSFEDFATPPKYIEKNKPDYERHWGAGVDEDDPVSPPKRPIVHKPRKDADTHWETADNSPAPAKTRSFQRQKGLGLYGDPLHQDARVAKHAQKPNVDNARRSNDFGQHYEMTDDSPAGAKVQKSTRAARSDQEANWSFESPVVEQKKIYKTAGDGMGSRSGGRAWGIGDDSDPEIDADVRPSARGRGVRAQQEARAGAELDF